MMFLFIIASWACFDASSLMKWFKMQFEVGFGDACGIGLKEGFEIYFLMLWQLIILQTFDLQHLWLCYFMKNFIECWNKLSNFTDHHNKSPPLTSASKPLQTHAAYFLIN